MARAILNLTVAACAMLLWAATALATVDCHQQRYGAAAKYAMLGIGMNIDNGAPPRTPPSTAPAVTTRTPCAGRWRARRTSKVSPARSAIRPATPFHRSRSTPTDSLSWVWSGVHGYSSGKVVTARSLPPPGLALDPRPASTFPRRPRQSEGACRGSAKERRFPVDRRSGPAAFHSGQGPSC